MLAAILASRFSPYLVFKGVETWFGIDYESGEILAFRHRRIVDSLDTVVMRWRTADFIVNELNEPIIKFEIKHFSIGISVNAISQRFGYEIWFDDAQTMSRIERITGLCNFDFLDPKTLSIVELQFYTHGYADWLPVESPMRKLLEDAFQRIWLSEVEIALVERWL